MSPRCAQKLARLQTIVGERAAWAQPLAQLRRMRQWVLEAEQILDGSCQNLAPKDGGVTWTLAGPEK